MQKVSAMVTTGWLSKMTTPSSYTLRILDASWHLPSSQRDPYKEYLDTHIPGALFFDVEKCRDLTSPYEHTLPHPALFADYVGQLGISNDTHVVVYDNHEKHGLFSSPRAWWMLRCFGHRRVSVLDGGLPKWISEQHPTSPAIPQVERRKFEVNYQPHLLKLFENMLSNSKTGSFQVVDARGRQRFEGSGQEPREDLKFGHIPNSVNVPFTSMIHPNTREIKSPKELKKIFEERGIDLTQPLAASCGSGITACVISLGAFVCGKEDVSVFDGSWEEYSQRASYNDIIGPPKDKAGG